MTGNLDGHADHAQKSVLKIYGVPAQADALAGSSGTITAKGTVAATAQNGPESLT
jgi:hypothetical protein